jgi:glycosyltransferase involved in cell wall biosynthesis
MSSTVHQTALQMNRPEGSKRILIINWRSPNDPRAGGAEIVTLEHAKRWVAAGHHVVWLSLPYSDLRTECLEGVECVYVGRVFPRGLSIAQSLGFLMLSRAIFLAYKSHYQGNVDIVIEEIHGIPLGTPLYVSEPLVSYIHEVAGEIWDRMYPFPFNRIGKIMEQTLLRLYRRIPFVTPSPSTQRQLKELGIESEIHVAHNGLTLELGTCTPNKEGVLTVLFLNRFVKMKGPERALKMFAVLRNRQPAKLWLAGKGNSDYVQRLRKQAEDLGVERDVIFWGAVSEAKKKELLSRAHVLINTSYKEGWGLVNIEANSQGTPVVAFRVPGNIDSVAEGISGFLCEDDDLPQMVDNIIRAATTLTPSTCIEYASQYEWDASSGKFLSVLLSATRA